MSLLLGIFALVFFTQAISWIGKAVLLEWAFAIHQRIFNAKSASHARTLKSDILLKKTELVQTSAQDQFAKWAKLRRQVDKGLADLEKHNSDNTSAKTAFSVKFTSALWIFTTGLQFFVGWWYRKSAVVYLPKGWFGPMEWWLALPFAPKGSVSVGVWQMACKRVIKVGERVVKEFLVSEPIAVAVPVSLNENEKTSPFAAGKGL